MELASSTKRKVIDLMDESKGKDVLTRRLALALSICCASVTASAADPPTKSGEASLRHLLTRGWSDSPTLPTPIPEALVAEVTPPPMPQAEEFNPELTDANGRNSEVASGQTTGSFDAGSFDAGDRQRIEETNRVSEPRVSLSELILGRKSIDRGKLVQQAKPMATVPGSGSDSTPKSGRRKVEQDDASVSPPLEDHADSTGDGKSELVDSNPVETSQDRPQSLADFLRASRTRRSTSTQPSPNSHALSNEETVDQSMIAPPARKPLPTRKSLEKQASSTRQIVRAAPKIATGSTRTDSSPTERREIVQPEPSDAARTAGKSTFPELSPPVRPGSPSSTLAAIPPRVLSVPAAGVPTPSAEEKVQEDGEFQVRSAEASSRSVAEVANRGGASPAREPSTGMMQAKPAEAMRVASSVKREQNDAAGKIAGRSQDGPSIQEEPLPLADPLPSPPLSHLAGDYPMLPIPALETAQSCLPPEGLPLPTPSVTLHTTRLLEVAQRSIVKSEQSLNRGATHTSRKYAIEAIQSVIAMRDAQAGGNQHSQQLERAFDAIRESKDFCGEFGTVDTSALQRMVTVHETVALKDQDLSDFTAFEATEVYLNYAKEQLVLATGGVREGSQALLLLGKVEFQIAEPGDAHATSVAVTVQRAAVEADQFYAVGYRVLGTSLLRLGLVEEAADCLIASLRIEPTRMAYESLLEVSRRLGDVDTARVCMKALQDPRMDEGSLVKSLTPEQFATTYRPNPTTRNADSPSPIQASSGPKEIKAQAKPAARIGFGSLFRFGRK